MEIYSTQKEAALKKDQNNRYSRLLGYTIPSVSPSRWIDEVLMEIESPTQFVGYRTILIYFLIRIQWGKRQIVVGICIFAEMIHFC